MIITCDIIFWGRSLFNKYLNEEKYKRNERTIIILAVLLLIIGLSLGGFLIYNWVAKLGTAKVGKLNVEPEKKNGELETKNLKYVLGVEYIDGKFMIAKRRSIYDFQVQQVMPVAKEGINEMAPIIGNAVGEIAKSVKKIKW